ncbi:MAG: chemotaxis protein CheW, partial [Acidobacteriota bacterium]
ASADAAPDAPASSDAPGLDPQRLYAFTDQLSAEDAARRAQAHEETVEARIETWVTFSLADEIYALPVHPVHEVLRVSQITRVPHAPHPIRGVTQVRGRVIPVIDLRVRLGLPPVDISRVSRILVIGSRGRRLGLLVDGVHQVAHLDLNRLQAPPEDVMTEQSDFLAGVHEWNDQLLLLLDVDRVLILPAQAAGVA